MVRTTQLSERIKSNFHPTDSIKFLSFPCSGILSVPFDIFSYFHGSMLGNHWTSSSRYNFFIRIQVPLLGENVLLYFAFMKDILYDLFSLPERNTKKIFTFTKNVKKQNSVQHWFCSQPFIETAYTPRSKGVLPIFFPGTHTPHLSFSPPEL